eukprot:COSAG02_NODE_811_length_16911_cov_343.583095_1_plen_426_part_00
MLADVHRRVRRGPSLMRDPYVAQPSRLIAPEDEKALLNKLLHDPRGERSARRRTGGISSICCSSEAATVGSTEEHEAIAQMAPVTMPTLDDREAVWKRFDAEGTGALSFDEIDQAVVELFGDSVCHKNNQSLRALALACQTVKLNQEGWVQRSEFRMFLQHVVYFANAAEQLECAEAECQHQQGRLTLGEFLRAAAAAGAPVSKTAAMAGFRTMVAEEVIGVEQTVPFEEFCRWCAHHHISRVPRDHEDEVQERLVLAAATASPKTLLGDTAAQLTQSISVTAGADVRSSVSPQRVDLFDVNPPTRSTKTPGALATTIRSSPEFAKRMKDLGLAYSEHEQPYRQLQQQDDQCVIADASTEVSTTAKLHTMVAHLHTTVLGLEDENAALKDELEDVRRQDKEDLALAVRVLLVKDCWFFSTAARVS